MAAVFLVFSLTVPLAGGRAGVLARARLARAPLIVAALALQVLVISVVPDAPGALLVTGHLASYGLAAAFLWANRSIIGLWIVMLGTACNAAAIVANGGVMPADAGALARAGRAAEGDGFENSAVVDDPVLGFLGDVFSVPEGFPLANVFSIGDALIVVGAVVALHELSGSRWARWRHQQGGRAVGGDGVRDNGGAVASRPGGRPPPPPGQPGDDRSEEGPDSTGQGAG